MPETNTPPSAEVTLLSVRENHQKLSMAELQERLGHSAKNITSGVWRFSAQPAAAKRGQAVTWIFWSRPRPRLPAMTYL